MSLFTSGHLRGQLSFGEQHPLSTTETEGGGRKPNEADCGRAKETRKIVTVQVIRPSVTTNYHISVSLSLRTTRACSKSIPSELSASVLDRQQNSLLSLFCTEWKTPDKLNEALWKKQFLGPMDLLWTGCSCAWWLIWHLAEVPQLTKLVTQSLCMHTVNTQKLATDGHLACSSAKIVCYLKKNPLKDWAPEDI